MENTRDWRSFVRIGIDAFGCDHGRSGIGSYLHSLVHNLPDSEARIELFGPELDRYTYTSGIDSLGYSGVPVSDSLLAERLWHLVRFPSFVRRQKYDAVLFPAGGKLLPLIYDRPSVVVVQEIVSDVYRNSDDGIFASILRYQLKRVDRIIAASEFIRDDLVRMSVDESRITVIHNGVDRNLFYPREVSGGEAVLIHPFSIRRPYIIYASRVVYPSKRHVELVRGFAAFKRRTGAPHRLVLAGADGVNAEVVHREVLKSPFASDILLTGYFPHQNLPDLYSAADACVFPAAAEGVGIPVVEAMACGIPVACARSGALPEIAGDCALFFDQDDPEDIARALERVVRTPTGENESLRSDMVRRGSEWVRRYDWKESAKATLGCVASLVR